MKSIKVDDIEFSYFTENCNIDIYAYVGGQNNDLEGYLSIDEAKLLIDFLNMFIVDMDKKENKE